MKTLQVTDKSPDQDLPDLSAAFQEELVKVMQKLAEVKGEAFDQKGHLSQAMCHYTMIMLFEYQEKGDQTVPRAIVNQLWNLMLKAAGKVYGEAGEQEFVDSVTDTFYKNLEKEGAVDESLSFWNYYYPG